MELIRLIIGENHNCLLCKHPRPLLEEVSLPWLLCPTHYGDLTDVEGASW